MSSPAAPVPGSRDAVLTLFVETWADLVERQFMRPVDRLAQDLLADAAVGRLQVCDPYRSAPIRLARRLQGRRTPAFPASSATQQRRLVQPLRARRRDPGRAASALAAQARYGRTVVAAARADGMTAPAVMTCNPLVAAFAGLQALGPVTYYARDDWAAHPSYRRQWPMFRDAYRELATAQVRVCAVSQALLDRIAPTGPSLVLPNGVDPAEWADPAAPPAWFGALPRPVALYTGTLDRRLDADLVAQTAAAVGSGSVLLLGPDADSRHVARLAATGNVVVHGHVGRAELTGIVRSSDVCVLPHVISPLTRAMSPLKLYEYLAAGRPVVAVDLPPVRAVDEHVVLVAGHEDFGAAVGKALADGPMSEGDRAGFVRAHTWRSRFAQLKALAYG